MAGDGKRRFRPSLRRLRQIFAPAKRGRPAALPIFQNDRLSPSRWEALRASDSPVTTMELGHARGDLTMAHVLENTVLLSRFAAFLENEYSIENLRFHESVSAFLEANGAMHSAGSRGSVGAAELVSHFVRRGAAEEVNLSAALREALVDAVRRSDAEELVKQMRAAKSEVFNLMERDSFSRFARIISADAIDVPSETRGGSFPGPPDTVGRTLRTRSGMEGMPRLMGGFGDNITITGTGISDTVREYIRVSGIVSGTASGAHRVSVDL